MLALSRKAIAALGCVLALAGLPAWSQNTHLKVLVPGVAAQPVFIARDQGIFARHGLDVDIAPAPTADAMIPQLLSGQVQFGLTSGLAVINAASKGIQVKLVASALNTSSAIQSAARLIVPGDSPIHTVADLKGKTVALGGLRSQPHLMVLAAARDLGIDPASISFVEMPVPAMQAAAAKGTVQAIYPFDPYLAALLKSGFHPVEPSLTKYLEGSPVIAFAAASDYLDRNPKIVHEFVAAMAEAYELANHNPQLVRDVDLKYTKLPPEYIRNREIQPFSIVIDEPALGHMAERMKEAGWITRVPAMTEIVDAHAAVK